MKVLTELSLRDSELRYRRLFEAAQDGILILDAKTGMIEDVNPYLIKMLGYSREEFIEKKLWEVGAFKDIEASKVAFEALQDSEYIRYEDLPLKTKDGRLIQVEFVSNVYLVGDEKVIQCDIRDITEHKQIITALQGNENKYHDLIDQSPDGYFIIELSGNILTVNKAMCKELEFSEEEFLSMNIWDIIPDQYLHQYRERLMKVLKGESLKEAAEYVVRGKEGGIHYVEVISAPRYSGRDIIGFQGIARDITARKQAEEALQESEAKFRRLVVHLPTVVYINPVGDTSTTLYVSPQIESLLGYTPQEWLADPKLWSNTLHPEDRQHVLIQVALTDQSNKPFDLEYRMIARDGRLVWVHDEITLVNDAKGQPQFWQGIMLDITERKRAEEQTRFQATLLNAVGQAVIATDAAGTVTYVNRATENLYGWRAEEAEGRTILEVTVPQISQTQAEEIMTQLSQGESWSGEFFVQHRDGRVFAAQVHDSPIFNNKNELIGVIGISSDITERKQAEDALREKGRLLSESQRIGHIGSWSYNILTDALQYSDEMCRLLDISAQEPRHNKAAFLTLIYASDQPRVTKWMEDIRAGRQVKELDFRLFHKNGELRYLQTRGAVIFDAAGKPVRFIGMAQDVSERKMAEIQIRQQIQRLTALSKIDQAIISTANLGTMMEAVLPQVIAQLQVDAADILLLNHDSQVLEYLTGSGFRTAAHGHVPVGKSLAGRVAKERRLLRIENLKDYSDDPFVAELLTKEGFVSYFGVPLITKGKVKGVLEVFHRGTIHPYTEWVDFLNTLAGQTAIAIENASLFANLEQSNRELSQAYDATIVGWSRALDLRDKETEGHTLRVTELTLTLAQKFSFTATQMLYIRWGGLLHDIGKMGIPDSILLKPDTLSEAEWVTMRSHPQSAYDLLLPIAFLTPALDIPYCHHEKWDGTGYPRGLKGEEIPLQARIFAVVDVWDALSSDRPYRLRWPEEKISKHIHALSGTHFDPQVVDVFMRSLNAWHKKTGGKGSLGDRTE
jgi:PAS domain S-box-containing protein/putative nucleotidyltransferase with HDIG domain